MTNDKPSESQGNGELAEPEESGSQPGQSPADEQEAELLSTVAGSSEIGAYPFSETVRDLGDSGVRGESAMAFLALHAQRLEAELRDSREKLEETRERLESARDAFHDQKERVAVLEERLKGEDRFRFARRVMISIGGILGGVGGPLLTEEMTSGVGWFLTVGSAVLLLTGWLIPASSAEEDSQ